jgi:cardiolipin-specific phospholipase
MGGYISTVYAMRYPEEIKKLLLLSPVGFPCKPDDYSPQNITNRMNSMTKKLGTKLLFKLWENQFSPFSVLRASGKFGS